MKKIAISLLGLVLSICPVYSMYHYILDDIKLSHKVLLLNKAEDCRDSELCSYTFDVLYKGNKITIPAKERLYFTSNVGSIVKVEIENEEINQKMIGIGFVEFILLVIYCAIVTQRTKDRIANA